MFSLNFSNDEMTAWSCAFNSNELSFVYFLEFDFGDNCELALMKFSLSSRLRKPEILLPERDRDSAALVGVLDEPSIWV